MQETGSLTNPQFRAIAFALFPPRPVLRERAGVRVFLGLLTQKRLPLLSRTVLGIGPIAGVDLTCIASDGGELDEGAAKSSAHGAMGRNHDQGSHPEGAVANTVAAHYLHGEIGRRIGWHRRYDRRPKKPRQTTARAKARRLTSNHSDSGEGRQRRHADAGRLPTVAERRPLSRVRAGGIACVVEARKGCYFLLFARQEMDRSR
jgi:hypothetical protein